MKNQVKSDWQHKMWKILPWLWIAAGYLLDIWYQIVPGKWIIDSDLASEMILSNILNQERSILSHNWYYSTELRVANMQWFYRLGLMLFPDDWHLARSFGMAIALLVFIAAALLLAHGIGLGSTGPWMAGALVWPFGMRYLVYAIYGGYYLIHMLLPMLVLALVLESLRAKKHKSKMVFSVAACLVALAAGLNGVKILMVFQAPFLLATAILLLIAMNECGETTWQKAGLACGTEMQLAAGALYTTAAALVGYIVNTKILAKLYSFKSFSSITWERANKPYSLGSVIVDFFHEFGYQDGVGVFRFSGIASGAGLLIGIWLLFCMVRLAMHYADLTVTERLIVLLLYSMIAVYGISFSYFQDYCQYFWFPCMPVAIASMAIEIKTEKLRLPQERQILTLILGGLFTLCSVNTVRQEIEHPALGRVGLDKVADWLVDNGYKEGYATFWNGSAMVEMTSGQLDVWMPGDLNSIDIEGWLQPNYHLTRYPEHPFVLVDTETDGAVENAGLIRNGNGIEVYNDGRYVVYAFDSAEEICSAAETTAAERAATQKSENN